MKFLENMFRKKEQSAPQPLAIEDIPLVPVTAEPDDAELAAQALLARMSGQSNRSKSESSNHEQSVQHDVAYYRNLAVKVKEGRAAEARFVMRYLAYVEEQLHFPKLAKGQLGAMERELYRRHDVAEREGGDFLHRWQHCLADVIMRQMRMEWKHSG